MSASEDGLGEVGDEPWSEIGRIAADRDAASRTPIHSGRVAGQRVDVVRVCLVNGIARRRCRSCCSASASGTLIAVSRVAVALWGKPLNCVRNSTRWRSAGPSAPGRRRAAGDREGRWRRGRRCGRGGRERGPPQPAATVAPSKRPAHRSKTPRRRRVSMATKLICRPRSDADRLDELGRRSWPLTRQQ